MSDVVNMLETALGYQHGAGPRLLNNKPDSRPSGADTWFERIWAKVGLARLDSSQNSKQENIMHEKSNPSRKDKWSKVMKEKFDIALKMVTMETGSQNPMPEGMQSTSINASDPGYQATADPPKDTQAVAVQPIAVPALQLDELKEITDNFSSKSFIGEGVSGRVYHGVLGSGQAAAIKKLDSSKKPDNEFLAQVSTISRLKHDNIVELLGYCIDGDLRVLAYEYASFGTLHDILHGQKSVKGAQPGPVLSWSQRVKIAVGVAKGLEYLHENSQVRIVHGDMKSRNVLLFEDHVAKVADFDLLNKTQDMTLRLQTTRILGTFGYHAPEYAMTGQLTSKSDVYSFGVVLLQLLTGRKAVDHTLPRGQQSLVTWASPKLSEDKVKQCVDP
ncbi:hypothetical protein L1887_27751 [Cichorium endivia]|nr:hypothetical protein L1887_27751 [Cichorium endivia]